MNPKQTSTAQPSGARAPYEAPAIEESASFERLALSCAMTPEQQVDGDCLPIPAANSSP